MHTRKRPIARQRGEPTLHSPKRCVVCGYGIDRGWTSALPNACRTRCLICETAARMRGFVWPVRKGGMA